MMIRVATIADLKQVVQLNLKLACEPSADMSTSATAATEDAIRLFFAAHLNSPYSRTWVAEVNHEVVAVGTLVFFVRPAVPGHMSAIEAYFSNLYTLPEHRRCGYATSILAAARSFAQSQGLTRMWLHTTDAGRKLYESVGFESPATSLGLKSA